MRTDDKLKIKQGDQLQRNDSAVIGGARDSASYDLGSSIRKQVESGASFSGGENDHVWLNRSGRGFTELSGISGLAHSGDGRAVGFLDLEQDGDPDLVVVSANAPFVQLYRNEVGDAQARSSEPARFVALRFVGGNHGASPRPGFAPRSGYGAKVRVRVAGREVLREMRCGEGFASQNSTTLIVGLGPGVAAAEEVAVEWPSGAVQRAGEVAAGTLLTVYEDPSQSPNGTAFVSATYGPGGQPVEPHPHASLALSDRGRRVRFGDAGAAAGGSGLRLYVTTFTACAACKKALPRLTALEATGEVELLGVPVYPADTAEDWRHYEETYRPAYEVVAGMPEDQIEWIEQQLVAELGVGCGEEECSCEPGCRDKLAIPSTLVTDASGTILTAFAGVPSVSDLRRVQLALGQRTAGSH